MADQEPAALAQHRNPGSLRGTNRRDRDFTSSLEVQRGEKQDREFGMSEEKPKYPPSTESQLRIAKPLLWVGSRINTWIYRATGGTWGRSFFGDGEVGILRVKGRKSGKIFDIPLCFARDGDDVIIIASQGGMPKHPLWYLNLVANPEVTFEIGPERRDYTAETVPEGENRSRLWALAMESYSDFDNYQARTTRKIPVIRLAPR